MKTIFELKKFIETSNPLTVYHQTVFSTFIELNKIKATESPEGIVLEDQNGQKCTIKQ